MASNISKVQFGTSHLQKHWMDGTADTIRQNPFAHLSKAQVVEHLDQSDKEWKLNRMVDDIHNKSRQKGTLTKEASDRHSHETSGLEHKRMLLNLRLKDYG